MTTIELADYVSRQINLFFPDNEPVTSGQVAAILSSTLQRLEICLSACVMKYFQRDGRPYFNHLHSDQYAMFLYLLGSTAHRTGDPRLAGLASKSYLLNKALHGLDLFYEVNLPEIFCLAHPVGTVLGRAHYANYFVAMQGCSVGNIGGHYPKFGEKVVLCSQAAVLGDCDFGDEVCVGAGSLIMNTKVPGNSTVVGRAQEVRILENRGDFWKQFFHA
ncbi:MAG: serine acetyltransferase [Verrucomicrobiota bacterium]